MEPEQVNAVVRLATTTKFDAVDVAIVEIDGRPHWSAAEVAAALGYARADHVADKVSTDWSDECEEGTDYRVLRGEDLAALKAAAPGLVDARAPSLLLLTESGVHLVCVLSRQPRAKALRRWLADEVLPSLRRTGRYAADVDDDDDALRLGMVLELLPEELANAPALAVLELLAMEALSGRRLDGMRRALSSSPPALTTSSAPAVGRRLTSFEQAFPTSAALDQFLRTWHDAFGARGVDMMSAVANPHLEAAIAGMPWTETWALGRALGHAFRRFYRSQPHGWIVENISEQWQTARWSVRPSEGAR